MCSMTPPIEHLAGAVAQRVDVDLDRVFEEAVDERGAFGREAAFAPEADPVRASSPIARRRSVSS